MSERQYGIAYGVNIDSNSILKYLDTPVIAIYNHPDGYPPSADDLVSARRHRYNFGLAVGHNGQVYKYYPSPRTFSLEELDNIQNLISLSYENMDIDRAYTDMFRQFGLKYDIL